MIERDYTTVILISRGFSPKGMFKPKFTASICVYIAEIVPACGQITWVRHIPGNKSYYMERLRTRIQAWKRLPWLSSHRRIISFTFLVALGPLNTSDGCWRPIRIRMLEGMQVICLALEWVLRSDVLVLHFWDATGSAQSNARSVIA